MASLYIHKKKLTCTVANCGINVWWSRTDLGTSASKRKSRSRIGLGPLAILITIFL